MVQKDLRPPVRRLLHRSRVGRVNVSDQGLRFIADCEGAVKRGDRHVLYNDPVGHCTIGYGHLVHLGNCNGSEPEEFKRGLTEDEAIALKRQDARRFVGAINRLVTVPLTQNQFDALVSLVFNIGEGQGGFEGSTLRRRLALVTTRVLPTRSSCGTRPRYRTVASLRWRGLPTDARKSGRSF